MSTAPLREPLRQHAPTQSRTADMRGKFERPPLRPVARDAPARRPPSRFESGKLASNPFVQQAARTEPVKAASGRENRPVARAESSVMSRSKTARKVSEATGALSHTRIRLSRQSLKSFPSIDMKAATSVSALQDSGKSPGGKWLDQERDHVQAYEYLCHCSEAQQWMERCIGEPLGGDIANMAEEMRNGIALAKVAKSFEPACVPRIFVHPKLQFRHTDNINYYFQFVDKIRLPSCFRFELTDLYEKKNFPKVVYCLHALSHFMAHHGRSDKVDDLVGKLEFDEEQLFKTQKTIEAAGTAMPSFGGVGQALAQEMGVKKAPAAPKAPPAPPAEPRSSPGRAARLGVEATTLQAQRAHLKHVEASPKKPATPHTVASMRAQLKPVDSEPTLRSPDKRAHDALERERERHARLEDRERARQERERERTRLREERERERLRLREEREQRAQDLERERAQLRAEREREREERDRSLVHATQDLERARREQLYMHVRSSTHRELARDEKEWRERLREAEERARAEEREERFKRELAHELERQRQAELYAAELAAAHAETAAVEARLQALAEESARRDAAERARAETRLAVPLQAQIRGALARQALFTQLSQMDEVWAVQLQAHVRGTLARRSLFRTIMDAEAHTPAIVYVQAAARGVLARRRLLAHMQALEQDAVLTALQARIRGALARRAFAQMRTAYQRIALVRAASPAVSTGALARRPHHELRKHMAYVRPDLTGVQAQIRGVLARHEYVWWRTHLHTNVGAIVYVQSLLRGVLARRAFDAGIGRFLAHIPDVVRVQSLCRARRARSHYRALRRGTGVPLDTVRALALDDGGRDYADERAVSQLRHLVVQQRRTNQSMEAHILDLDRKIALLVKNKIGIEDIVKARTERGWLGASASAAHAHVLAEANDPFAAHVLTPDAQRRLEAYQALFYVLQTQPTYLARLLVLTNAADVPEHERGQLEQTVLAMFAYAQQPREEYLLLKLVQATIHTHAPRIATLSDWATPLHAPFQRMLIHLTCGVRERTYLCAMLTPPMSRLLSEPHLELDAVAALRTHADMDAALEEPATRAEFLHRLQALRAVCETFVNALRAASPPTPYGLQFVARAHFDALRTQFPHAHHTDIVRAVAYTLYHSYIHPAIVAPEAYGMPSPSDHARRQLACLSHTLHQIARGTPFDDADRYLQPLNEYVLDASTRVHHWVQTLLDTYVDAEHHFGLDEWTDLGSTHARPVIYISPNEVYAIHQLLCTNVASLTDSHDALAELLAQLGTPPVSTTPELSRARDGEVTLALSHHHTDLAHVHDVDAEDKLLFSEAKQLVMAVLRIQQGPANLLDLFVAPVSEADEAAWAARRTQPPYAGTPTADLSFAELKAKALERILHLEQLGRVHRANAYQDMLDAMAADIRRKDQRRQERRAQRDMLQTTLTRLQEQQQFMESQIKSYETCMDRGKHAMQKPTSRRRRLMDTLPFSPQFFHQRSLKAAGMMPTYGSYRYSATRLHAKGILAYIERPDNLAIDQLSFTIASDQVGVFELEASVGSIVAGNATLRMDDLLEAQYANQTHVGMLDGAIQFHLTPLIRFINKKFYT